MATQSTDGPLRRIVCLTEEPTEILYALGEGERVVGISAWTERPPEARTDKPIVSGFTGGNVEKICALEPDLVIGFSDIQAELASKLIARNQQVLIFNQRSLAEILDVILVLGRMVGREARALELVAAYRATLEATRARHADGPRPRVYFEEWPDPRISGIRWVSELIEIAGGVDICAARSHGKLAKERFVTDAEVFAAAPDVIVASWCGKPVDMADFARRPGWDALPAVQQGRIREIPSALILQPGPACLTAGLAALERAIHEA
ncbi:MAG: cobalamin-binding protein [Planctomycetota bacterium]|nr:cobalamin-binding protein [Planctomycetota bacterium]